MNNNWLEHVKQYQQEHNVSYKEALKLASKTYKISGGGTGASTRRQPPFTKQEIYCMRILETFLGHRINWQDTEEIDTAVDNIIDNQILHRDFDISPTAFRFIIGRLRRRIHPDEFNTIVSGSSLKSDLVRRMYYSKNFNPKRVSNPSKNIKMAVKKQNKKEYDELEKEFEEITNKK